MLQKAPLADKIESLDKRRDNNKNNNNNNNFQTFRTALDARGQKLTITLLKKVSSSGHESSLRPFSSSPSQSIAQMS